MIPFFNQKKQIQPAILLLTLIAISCSQPKSKMAVYGNVFDSVMLNETGVFRGFNLGDKMDSVKLKESGKAMESDNGYLYYEVKLDTACSFNITYNFDEKGLSEIQSDIYVNNATITDEVFSKFKTYFDRRYGESQSHQGYTVWTVKSEKFGIVRINLSDESSHFITKKAPGKISLWIYPDKEYL